MELDLKNLASILLFLLILIDNLSAPLESAAVSAAITSMIWTDRIMGHSEEVRLPVRCAWVATGNNPTVSSEIARRVVRIRLDAKQDRPWEREPQSFLHADLRAWVAEHRSEVVRAALTLVQAWLAAGRPTAKDCPSLGSFEDWSRVIGGILEVAGVKGFLQNRSEFYDASDEEGKAWRSLVAAWWETFEHREVGVKELFPVAMALDVPLDIGGKDEKSQRMRFGKLLRRVRDRTFNIKIDDKQTISLKIVSPGTKQRAEQWQLVNTEAKDQERAEKERAEKLDPWD